MAGGYSSDDSYEEIAPKQSRSLKKEQRNSSTNSSLNTTTPGKHTKDKNSTDTSTFIIPEILCQCQQKCTERVTAPLIQKVCMYFKGLPNRNRQYIYLSKLIQIKVKQINGDEKTTKGKPFRKMGFKYFVPVLAADDMKRQIEERKTLQEKEETEWRKEKQSAATAEDAMPPDKVHEESAPDDSSAIPVTFPDWDHIEVCLNAFTAIHIISEKRVTITRATYKLQTEMKCSKPFPGFCHAGAGAGVGAAPHSAPIKKKFRPEEAPARADDAGKKFGAGLPDVSRLAAEWLATQAAQAQKQKPSFAINPKTLLPEGLVLPASVTCLPIFPRETAPSRAARDHDRDIDIVDSFFSDQLWKPEYIGGVP